MVDWQGVLLCTDVAVCISLICDGGDTIFLVSAKSMRPIMMITVCVTMVTDVWSFHPQRRNVSPVLVIAQPVLTPQASQHALNVK